MSEEKLNGTTKKILLVDDAKMIRSILERELKKEIDNIEILKAKTYKDGLKYILKYGSNIDVAILDLHLPDSKDGAMIDIVESNNIKSIVLSERLDDDLKNKVLDKSNIVDCIAKDGDKSIKSTVFAASRILNNKGKNILIVDDSKMQLSILEKILHKLNLNVTTALNGKEALDIIEKSDKKFSLVMTDYSMPEMDGMELTFKLREVYDKDELSIIVLSSDQTTDISAQFLKIGANDFINKPYLEMEVLTRVNSNLELIELFQKTKDMANRDFLTNLYNRRYFFEVGNMILDKSQRKGSTLSIAMIDIDKFKAINDTYGHDVGDDVIIDVGNILRSYTRKSDLVARFGGEEFCMIIDAISYEDAVKFFEKIRATLHAKYIMSGEHKIDFTTSIGVCHGLSNTLEDMIKVADEQLYICKNTGRNKTSIEKLEDYVSKY